MIVEFTGISGSGKSALARIGTRDLARSGHSTLTRAQAVERYMRGRNGLWDLSTVLPEAFRSRILLYLFRLLHSGPLERDFAESHPEPWAAFLGQLERIRRVHPADFAYGDEWTREVAAFYMALRRAVPRDAMFLWEEGIAHRVVNLFATTSVGVETETLRGILALWPFPDAIVEVQADPELCLRRIKARGISPRLRGKKPQEILAFLTNSGVVVGEIVSEAERRKIPVLKLTNNSESLEQTMASSAWARLLSNISKLNGPPAAPSHRHRG